MTGPLQVTIDDLTTVPEAAVRIGWSQPLGMSHITLIPFVSPCHSVSKVTFRHHVAMTSLVTHGGQSLVPFFTRAEESITGNSAHQMLHPIRCVLPSSSDEGYGTGDTVGFLIKLPQSNGKL